MTPTFKHKTFYLHITTLQNVRKKKHPRNTRVNPQAKRTFPLAEFDVLVGTRGAHSAALPVTEHLPLMNADNERVSISALRAQSDTLRHHSWKL